MYQEPLGVYVDVLVMLDSYAANFLRFALWTYLSQLSDIPNLVDKLDLEWLLRPTDERDMTKPRDASQDIDVFDFCSSTAIAARDAVLALGRLSTKTRLHSAGDAISLLEWLGMSVREDILMAREAKLSEIS
ncbi:hypothetical protein CEP52_016989 [Fusarium oligoseptatum]|uniref:Uncharacterized protein n=1 Tax=Fusarium oligoseptatum TaxID=2604345 RepID=A0A428RXR5_9HYPO|nr:hypothetical protein CEP52_016989 [Fusarium oligoseptatum]